ncbi:calcium-activated potassium channel subunit beta-2 isoform X1 [Ictalurus punctatus]|uniref:Calcium-activated potassium channel subunit beta-2 isoform X1 n=3 Tax=Ictalurus punctatus TaxID=7998 RepID=A0A2D0RVQ3_ICTPU|nr:calcium-activated potassium channel subunit beta-2 isoform X1 [Ictalurus punctatus]XP_047014101.1 calcium-activated potassium channel subunit beta-2 isoform X1 [Ictalurus punctatus]XP_053539116.1 calcium-activated potassium channel subunit beta-2 isoform X1 [Ictalurus punctatus]
MAASYCDCTSSYTCQRQLYECRISQQSLASTLESAGRMFLWAGTKGPQGSGNERTIYQKIREYDILDKRKTVTALKAGEDRAILLGLSMIFFSVMMYFVLGITMVRSYTDSVWTEESSCTVLNSTIIGEINCSYSCGAECWKSSRYPCLQVYISLNSSGRIMRLSHNEEAQEANPECFFVPKCRKDHAMMHTLVLNISERLKVQQQVRCYTDPTEQQDSAILMRLYGRSAILSSLLWPTCTFVIGVLIVAMVKLTQYLSILCERISRIKRTGLSPLESASHSREGSKKCSGTMLDGI